MCFVNIAQGCGGAKCVNIFLTKVADSLLKVNEVKKENKDFFSENDLKKLGTRLEI